MSKIPTAEEFCKSFKTSGKTWKENFHETMIEFAKLHVKAALEAEHKNMQLPEEDLEFTLSSYDLNEIK
jgi:hypothetical protein